MAARPSRSRFVGLDGCFNFRDLGGYRTEDGETVAWQMLYRSDSLHRLTGAGRAAFRALDVATVLDLRTTGEVAEQPWTPPGTWSGRWWHLPLLERAPDWSAVDPAVLAQAGFAAEHYWQTAMAGAAALRTAVETLARPGALPAVFHCAAGKDRTGILAGLILRLLGVPVGAVADDYALSEQATARWHASLEAGCQDDTQAAWAYVPPSMAAADPATLLAFLRRIDAEYGSVQGFARHLQVSADAVDRFRAALLR
jgi:protein-tyrosine phosphatase